MYKTRRFQLRPSPAFFFFFALVENVVFNVQNQEISVKIFARIFFVLIENVAFHCTKPRSYITLLDLHQHLFH